LRLMHSVHIALCLVVPGRVTMMPSSSVVMVRARCVKSGALVSEDHDCSVSELLVMMDFLRISN